MQYKIMGSRLRLKKHIVSHNFCGESNNKSQLTSAEKKRKLQFQKSLQKQSFYSPKTEPKPDLNISSKRKLGCESLKKVMAITNVTRTNSESEKEIEITVIVDSTSGNIRIDSITEKKKTDFLMQGDVLESPSREIVNIF